jgi:hypothetical protein
MAPPIFPTAPANDAGQPAPPAIESDPEFEQSLQDRVDYATHPKRSRSATPAVDIIKNLATFGTRPSPPLSEYPRTCRQPFEPCGTEISKRLDRARSSGVTLTPQRFAEMFVDDNFSS